MADNITLPNGQVVATKEIAGAHYQCGIVTDIDGNPVDLATGADIAAVVAAIAGIPGGSAGTEYVEDAASAANPTGRMTMARRRDTLTGSEVSADGDNIALNATAKGELYTHDTDLLIELQAVHKAEDAAHASGDKGIMILVVRRDTPASGASADGDYATLNVGADGRLWTAALCTGDIAHDAVDSGSPIKMGGKAYTNAPAAVADGDRVNTAHTLRGAMHASLRNDDGTPIDLTAPAYVISAGDKLTPTALTTTNGAYSADDVIGGKLTFSAANRASGGAGWLQAINIGVKAAVTPALELWLFDADPTNTTIADNGAWSLNAADLAKVCAVVKVASADWLDAGTPNFVSVELVRRYELGATQLYGYLVTRSAVTLTSTSDVTLNLQTVFD